METEKINKECSNIYLIDHDFCLSDSLNIVNTNFKNLSAQINNIQKYYDMFQSFYTFFESNSSKYFNTLTYVNQFSANWDSAYNTINDYKEKWNSSPIYLIYPNLIEFDRWYLYTDAVKDNIVHWLETNFPSKDYSKNQKINISLNLTKPEYNTFNFKKSYDEKCTVFNSATKKCEKCNNVSPRTCCVANDYCINKTKLEYIDNITPETNIKGTIKSNSFDINFLNPSFNIEYGAKLKNGFVIAGTGKLGNLDVSSKTLNSDIDIEVEIDRIRKNLYLNYDIKTEVNRTIVNDVSVKREASPQRDSIFTGSYSIGETVSEKALNVFNNTPVFFGNLSAGRYRLVYVKGAISIWPTGNRWSGVPVIKIMHGSYRFYTDYLDYTDSINAVKNASTANQGEPWFHEFDHRGGAIDMLLEDSSYNDNRILNNVAPTFKLVKMIPNTFTTGPDDGLYDMINLTNPFDYPASFKFEGTIDNQLYLNGVPVTDFLTAKTSVTKTINTVSAGGTVNISIYTSQKSDVSTDYAEVVGKVTWYCLQDIPSDIGFNGDIEWFIKCLPEIKPDYIDGCNICNNCDVIPENKQVSIECGKLSGDKTLNINYTKGISDKSIYRTFYITFENNNGNWIYR
jgi:hypothetical protein